MVRNRKRNVLRVLSVATHIAKRERMRTVVPSLFSMMAERVVDTSFFTVTVRPYSSPFRPGRSGDSGGG